MDDLKYIYVIRRRDGSGHKKERSDIGVTAKFLGDLQMQSE